MTYNWSSGFEEYPRGNFFGSTMGQALRDLKGAFEERIGAEHIFASLTSDVTMIHKVGQGSIVGMSDGTPASKGVDGGVQWDYDEGLLYRDTGAGMNVVTTKDHGGLDGLTEDDHTMYMNFDGDTITADITVPSLTNLPIGEDPADGAALSRAGHLNDAAAGGARHDNDVINPMPTDISIDSLAKLKWNNAASDVNVAATGTNMVLSGRHATMIRVVNTPAPDQLMLFCSTENVDDYIGRFRGRPYHGLSGTWSFEYEYLT